jgi:hypothetical protein
MHSLEFADLNDGPIPALPSQRGYHGNDRLQPLDSLFMPASDNLHRRRHEANSPRFCASSGSVVTPACQRLASPDSAERTGVLLVLSQGTTLMRLKSICVPLAWPSRPDVATNPLTQGGWATRQRQPMNLTPRPPDLPELPQCCCRLNARGFRCRLPCAMATSQTPSYQGPRCIPPGYSLIEKKLLPAATESGKHVT